MPSAPPAATDIMDALLCADDATPYPGQQALERLIRRAAAPLPAKPAPGPESSPAGPTLRPVPAKARQRQAKRKATHYFAPEAVGRLESARTALDVLARQSAPGQTRRVSKSAVLEAALTLACDAFEAAGPGSPLARRLLSQPAPTPPKTGG
ncbi:hypothetical protein [Desulfovibrio sp. TomC]|uniref:hypothetical protein n=1 Tax=Desulfovibrio sp. TomC TaxID=1562888 RepID=UPI0005735422|nr:hypothetical protein [Desulfovibrio sp. TomC]KHK02533.1 hypothetical protein NY78_1890 [Desulfovibrio sp. TomC]